MCNIFYVHRLTSYCEGTVSGKVTLTNPTSGEYMYYTYTATITTSDQYETVSMTAGIRQQARQIIHIDNPLLATDIVHMSTATPQVAAVALVGGKASAAPAVAVPSSVQWWHCSSPYIRVAEVTALSGNKEGAFAIEYMPLLPTTASPSGSSNDTPTQHTLTIATKELGVYKYNLSLTATLPLTRPVIRIQAALGTTETYKYSFISYNTTKADYTTSFTGGVSSPFTTTKTITAAEPTGVKGGDNWEGMTIQGMLSYEPTELGEIKDILTILSPVWGEYTFDIIGVCTQPTPQGPIELGGTRKTIEIPVRNPFNITTTWTCRSDTPAFKVTTGATLSLVSKGSGICVVTYDPTATSATAGGAAPSSTAGTDNSVVGKLYVSCTQRPEITPWIYYLKAPNKAT